ncbi:methyltransferase domain-containing protein [Clostridium thermobutyricum]|uniref:methyltransferase domain-containing protein n=1 Tax=Clostridium thermobutyricum TaxID=29372 RepID=UPI002942E7EC|nr:methyltransferase domain-containing protein [Clostridium thermobutyricum]
MEKFNLNNCKAISCDLIKSDNLEKYDCIYTSMAMHHIIDVEEILNRFYEILNEKGKLCIVELNKDNGDFHKNEEGFNGHNGFSQKDLKNILEKY